MTTGTVIPLLSDEEMRSLSVLSFLFGDSKSPQSYPSSQSCQKPNFVPYIMSEWLLKILTHPKMGICKGASGLPSIITGNFALFVNTAEEAVL